MASTGKKGKKNKGKTVPLNDFLSNTISWSDQVDEADKLGEFTRKPVLPVAPRSARALEIDESKIPKNPPYVAYVSNLSYELQDGDILNAFVDLNVTNVRLPKDERSGRLKGFGYVEFGDRDSFISGLMKYEATIRGRRIKIDVAENEGERRRGGPRDLRDRDSNYDSEKTLGDWRSGSKRAEFASSDDRRGPMSGRKDYGGFRDRDNYDKGRGESNWRDSERRYGADRENRNFGSRRNYDESEPPSEPKTRTKLNLQPRTLPIEEIVVREEPLPKKEEKVESSEKSSASIFGQAKPVDTAAREREIEQRLEKEKGGKGEKEFDKSKPKNSEDDPNDGKRSAPPESKENIWVRRSQRGDTQDGTSRDSSGEKANDLDEADKETEKKNSENTEESSSRYGNNRRHDDYESDRDRDNDSRYGRYSKNESRYNDRNRDGERSYGRDDRWRDDKDRRDRDRDRRDYDRDRRDRGYDSDRRNNLGRPRDRDDDSRRYDRDGDSRRYNERERDSDWREGNDRDGDNRRGQDRDGGRYRDHDDYGGNRGSRGDKRGLGGTDRGSRPIRSTHERERGPQSKERLREQKKVDDGLRLPKYKEAAAPNYVGTNKYSCLNDDDGISE